MVIYDRKTDLQAMCICCISIIIAGIVFGILGIFTKDIYIITGIGTATFIGCCCLLMYLFNKEDIDIKKYRQMKKDEKERRRKEEERRRKEEEREEEREERDWKREEEGFFNVGY